MTVVIPGMNMNFERVPVRPQNVSLGPCTSPLMRRPLASVLLRVTGAGEHPEQVAQSLPGQPDRAAQQGAGVERGHAVVRAELPRPRHPSLGQELPDRARQRP